MDAGLIDEPGYMLFHLIDSQVITGHPATVEGLKAHLAFLPSDRNIEWTVNALGGNLFALTDTIAPTGRPYGDWHGDYPYPELAYPTNEELIKQTVSVIKSTGREMATPDDVREILSL